MAVVLGTTGRYTLNALYALATVCVLMVDTTNWLFIEPLRGRGLRLKSTVEHFVEFGFRSMPIVGMISFLIGVILAMQSAYTLKKLGAQLYIADLVSISALRELAPLMTAILITGRSGSAITAEIGSMKVAEEIDALHVMGLNPTKYLVVPKFLAMLLAVPCVTILAMAIMILGGYVVAVFVINIDSQTYYDRTAAAMVGKDLFSGLVKSFFFAIVICWTGVFRGFQVEGGAEGVGKMTTSSVVTSIFLIIVVDMLWTVLFYFT